MNDYIELREIISIFIKRWWVPFLLAILVGAAGYGYSFTQQPTYRSKTSLMVGYTLQATVLSRSQLSIIQQFVDTYADLATRQPILQGAITTLGLPQTWQDLSKVVRVETLKDTPVIEISVDAATPESAKAIADEIARQLILSSPTTQERLRESQSIEIARQRAEALRASINAGQRQLQVLESMRNTVITSTEQLLALEKQIKDQANLITNWERSYDRWQPLTVESTKTNYLSILEPGIIDPNPIRPRPVTNAIVGALSGGLLGLFLVFLWAFLLNDTSNTNKGNNNNSNNNNTNNNRVAQTANTPRSRPLLPAPQSPSRVFVGVQNLGNMSEMPGNTIFDKLLVNQKNVPTTLTEFDRLQNNLQGWASQGPAVFLIASPSRGDGRSTIVSNLGIALAQAGRKTIIVDADLRNPNQQNFFQLFVENGLSALLYQVNANINDYVKESRYSPNLKLLCAGKTLPSNPAEILGSQAMATMLATLKTSAEVILLDTPAGTLAPDAVILSRLVDGVVVLADANQTSNEVLNEFLTPLRGAGANVLGVVYNRVRVANDVRPTPLYSVPSYTGGKTLFDPSLTPQPNMQPQFAGGFATPGQPVYAPSPYLAQSSQTNAPQSAGGQPLGTPILFGRMRKLSAQDKNVFTNQESETPIQSYCSSFFDPPLPPTAEGLGATAMAYALNDERTSMYLKNVL